jgi:hypothetical protein
LQQHGLRKGFGCVSFQLKPSRRLAKTTKFCRQNLRDVLLFNSFETHPKDLMFWVERTVSSGEWLVGEESGVGFQQ